MLLRARDSEPNITAVRNRIAKAQQLVGRYVKRGTRLSDELIAERRADAKRE